MPYRGNPIAEKLDRLALGTGVPSLQRRLRSDAPRRSRIMPALFLAFSVLGLAVQIALPGWTGFWIVWAAWIATTTGFGQLGPLGPRRKLDEREAALAKHSHFVGLLWTFGVTVLGALAIAIGKAGAPIGLWDIWAPASAPDWMTVTLFLLALEVNVAELAARAHLPEPLDDED